jgi:N-acetyl-beta-hexosaminidase
MKALVIAAIACLVGSMAQAQTVSPLFGRGYTVIPEPQQVTLGAENFTFGPGWQLKLESGVAKDDVAVETLREDLASRFNVRLGSSENSGGTLSLRIQPGSVAVGKSLDSNSESIKEQTYRIEMHPRTIRITANSPTGLFYGVETLIQLLRRDQGTLWFPEGTIVDWPDLQLRHIYWDDNHHLEHVDELKRDLRQAA